MFLFSTQIIASGQEYKGTQKFLKGVGSEYDPNEKGFDIEYVLEGRLHNFILIDQSSKTITFEYDSKGISEDVLIIYLLTELAVYVNGDQEPNAIRSTIQNETRIIIPLFEDSKTITIEGINVISKENVDDAQFNDIKSKEQISSKNNSELDSNGGGCLIATATYGSELSPQVQKLREIRDNKLLHSAYGSMFMKTFNEIYYSFSPPIADFARENPIFKESIKLGITPLISSLLILNHLDMDSETEVLGYGISLIFLNLGMYLGIPIVVLFRIKIKLQEFKNSKSI